MSSSQTSHPPTSAQTMFLITAAGPSGDPGPESEWTSAKGVLEHITSNTLGSGTSETMQDSKHNHRHECVTGEAE